MGKEHTTYVLKSYRASWLQSLRHTNLTICLAPGLPWANLVCFSFWTPGALMAVPHAAWMHRAPRFCLNFPTNLSRSREGRGPGKFGGPPPLYGVASAAQTHLQQCWGPSGLWGGSESVCGAIGAWLGTCLALWGLLQAKCWDLFELELVKAAAAGGISGLTAPGLCCRSDYLRWGEVGRAGAAPRSS